jgi:hypothetical protein
LSSTGILDLQQATTQKNERYFANAHFTSQDILNEENGGITTSDFEDEDQIMIIDNDSRFILLMRNHF